MNYLWLIYALLSAVTASFVAIFGKIGLKTVDPNAATAIRSIVMAVFLFGVITVQGKLHLLPTIISNKRTFYFIICSGLAGAFSWLFYFLALKYGPVTKVAPIDKLSVVIAALLAILFLGEKINTLNLIGIGFITVGAIIVAIS